MRSWEREGRIDLSWKEEYCQDESNWKNCLRYQMEEKGIPHEGVLPDGSRVG